jgi:hypothetical protein
VAQGANAGVTNAYQAALGSLGGLGGTTLNITPTFSLPSLSGDIASGVTSGLTGAASGVGATVLRSLGVARLPDLLWRAGLLIVALVLIIVVAQALSAQATQQAVESVANSRPVQTATRVAALVR